MGRLLLHPPGSPGPVTVELEPGERLMDALDTAPAPGVPFGCRAGTCGTCRVAVLEGADGLVPPDAAELALLSILVGEQLRLACLCRARR